MPTLPCSKLAGSLNLSLRKSSLSLLSVPSSPLLYQSSELASDNSCLAVVFVGLAIVFSPLAAFFGFTALPRLYFLILILFVAAYLIIVESLKRFSRATLHTSIIKP